MPICYVAINIQIRARILLALIKFVDVLEAILILLRRIVIGLHGIIIAMLSEDSYGEIKKLFNSISKALAGIVSSGADEETISKMINDYIKTVNAFYRESQKITDEFIQNETAPVSLDDTTYG